MYRVPVVPKTFPDVDSNKRQQQLLVKRKITNTFVFRMMLVSYQEMTNLKLK